MVRMANEIPKEYYFQSPSVKILVINLNLTNTGIPRNPKLSSHLMYNYDASCINFYNKILKDLTRFFLIFLL